MKYLHTMVRVENIENSLNFYCNLLGLKEVRRKEKNSLELKIICLDLVISHCIFFLHKFFFTNNLYYFTNLYWEANLVCRKCDSTPSC